MYKIVTNTIWIFCKLHKNPVKLYARFRRVIMSSQVSHHRSHRHHHSLKHETKLQRTLRYTILVLFCLAVAVMIPYFAHKFCPFIKSVMVHRKVNISSICYIALRFLLMIFPLSLALPALIYNDYIQKPNLIAKLMNLVAFFFFASTVADIFSYNVLSNYVDDGSDPIMLKLLWNDISLVAVAFSLIEGTLWLITSRLLTGHKKHVKYMFLLTIGFGIIAPYAYMYMTHQLFTPAYHVWFSKNIYFQISQLLTLIGLFIAASSRWLWSSAFWH